MKKTISVSESIDICDICGISHIEYNKKYNAKLLGFGSSAYKVLGYISICPNCEKFRDKDWREFHKIITYKLQIRKILFDGGIE